MEVVIFKIDHSKIHFFAKIDVLGIKKHDKKQKGPTASKQICWVHKNEKNK